MTGENSLVIAVKDENEEIFVTTTSRDKADALSEVMRLFPETGMMFRVGLASEIWQILFANGKPKTTKEDASKQIVAVVRYKDHPDIMFMTNDKDDMAKSDAEIKVLKFIFGDDISAYTVTGEQVWQAMSDRK